MAKKFYVFGKFNVIASSKIPEEFRSQIPVYPCASIVKGHDGQYDEYSIIMSADTCQTDPDMLVREIRHKLEQIGADSIKLQHTWEVDQ